MLSNMRLFTSKVLLWVVLSIILVSTHAFAESDEIIHHQLSLAGYEIGMTYDDALFVRSVLLAEDTGPEKPEFAEDYLDAYASNIFVDGIEMNLWLRFKHERLFKIIAHFNPGKADELAGIFHQALGPAEDKSRSYADRDGNDISQTVYFWDFPTAKMYQVKTSDNNSYATIGLTAKPAFAETFSTEE